MRVVQRVAVALPAQASRLVHCTAAAAGVLGRIRRVLEQARPDSEPAPAAGSAPSASRETKKERTPAQQQARAQARTRAQAQTQAVRARIQEECRPADPILAMPKSFGAFEQPGDAQVARVVLLGTANVGKSTLVNQLVGSSVTIVSPRPQTTRSRIMAVATTGNKQLVFLDTPGVVSRQALRRVSRSVVTAPWATLPEADCAVLLLDGYRIASKTCEAEDYLFRHLAHIGDAVPPLLLAVNKIDLVEDRARVLDKAREYQARCAAIVDEPLLISARDNIGVDDLRARLLARTRPGRWALPADATSDMSDLTRVEELIRAEWFARLSGFRPYMVRQRNVGWEETTRGTAGPQAALVVKQELVVSSDDEAVALVGTDGNIVRDMAQSASRAIAAALGRPARVHLQVVVEKSTRRRK
ncbi:hypothetical protein H4R21_003447 [Coemansia helicoidea]|uniref:Uncharacterized protein n=1 Tax=Coemansia helicoidea TaxID=1286919 RepID=A0ACC1L3D1_9FUNG|nr:hypothetical protein H4R21_003447 [Coemansia helicoidea]